MDDMAKGLAVGQLYYEMMRFADKGLGMREDGREKIRGFANRMKAILSDDEPCGCKVPVTREVSCSMGMDTVKE